MQGLIRIGIGIFREIVFKIGIEPPGSISHGARYTFLLLCRVSVGKCSSILNHWSACDKIYRLSILLYIPSVTVYGVNVNSARRHPKSLEFFDRMKTLSIMLYIPTVISS